MKQHFFSFTYIIFNMIMILLACTTMPGASETFSAGDLHTIKADNISFNLVYVPDKTFKDPAQNWTAPVTGSYWIGETEVTYELWSSIHTWAVAHGYVFSHPGVMGDGKGDTAQHPVTGVNWRDCLVWCNAATEWYNAETGTDYSCTYKYGGATIRDSTDETACDNAEAEPAATGFRLPTSNEWELAACFREDLNNDGDIMDADEQYPSSFASGAAGDHTDAAATGAVAWYEENSGSSTHAVKGKAPNTLGIYDLSGNVAEWCFDLMGERRIVHGGTWKYGTEMLQTGYKVGGFVTDALNILGFRIAKNR